MKFKRWVKAALLVSLYCCSIYLAYFIGMLSTDEILFQNTQEVSPKVWATAELRRKHLFLAEYERSVKFFIGQRVYPIEVGTDTGGYADIRIYYQDKKIMVSDIKGRWFVIDADKERLYIERVSVKPKYLGKFTLVSYSGFKNFQYIAAKENEYEAPYNLKGG